jgi:hypothetical protein
MIGNFFYSNSGGAAYEIEQSLRFNSPDSARLYRTLAASQTRTYSFWYKYANLSGGNMYLFHHKNSGDTNYLGVRSGGSPAENQWQTLNQGASFTQIFSSRKYRDPSAWQHVLWKCTSTNVTMYVNGVEFASTGGANTSLSGGTLEIGARGSAEYFGGYIAEFHLVDGTALAPTDFGEFDDNGVWRPIAYTGSYGTNGFYLKFDPSATNGIGHDHSGNGNNFTATGFTTSGFESDCMVDTPTSNHPTINPVGNTAGNVFNQGNLEIEDSSGGGSWQGCQATIPFPTTGKWYYEMRMGGGTNNIFFGISSDAGRYASIMHDHADTFAIRQSDCDPRPTGATTTGTKSGYGTNDIAGIAVNCDTGVIQFYKNGSLNVTFVTTFDPAKTYFASFMSSATGTQTMYFNFGAQGFAYTPPTGYNALNTANLPEPTVKDGSQYFNTVLYTGNGSNGHAITGVGFPDLILLRVNAATLVRTITGLMLFEVSPRCCEAITNAE